MPPFRNPVGNQPEYLDPDSGEPISSTPVSSGTNKQYVDPDTGEPIAATPKIEKPIETPQLGKVLSMKDYLNTIASSRPDTTEQPKGSFDLNSPSVFDLNQHH